MGEVGSDSINTRASAAERQKDGTGGETILMCHSNCPLSGLLAQGAWSKRSAEKRESRQPLPRRALPRGTSEQALGGAQDRRESLSGRASPGFLGNSLLSSDAQNMLRH